MILILLNRNTYTRFTGVNEVEKDNGKGDKSKPSLCEL